MTRLVGSRSLVFCRNALVNVYMFPFYLEWCHYLTNDVGQFNWLHVRTLSKLRCKEVYAGLIARALMMVHIFQPLLVVAKSKKADFKFLDQGPFVRHALDVSKAMEIDPSFLLQKDWNFFEGDEFGPVVLEEHRRWLNHNDDLVGALFDLINPSQGVDEEDFTELLVPILRSYGSSLAERFNTGVWAKFQEGGEYFNPDADTISKLADTLLHTDPIEGFFGQFDHILTTLPNP